VNLPGAPRLHVWTGLIVATIGILVGGYAYTGDRIYHLEFLAVALFGFALLVVGGILAGYGQANRPRLGHRDEKPPLFGGFDEWWANLTGQANPTASNSEADPEPNPEPETETADEDASNTHEETDEDSSDSGAVTVDLACPDCEATFSRTGQHPIEAQCPNCGYTSTVEAPVDG
jgi:hypothetical protein